MRTRVHWFRQTVLVGNKKKLIIIAVFAFLVVLAVGMVCWHKANSPRVFTVEDWNDYPTQRIYMLDSLLEQYNGLKGMTKEEVLGLLGTNTLTAYSDTYIIGRGKLGQPGISMQLFFDAEGLFIAYNLFQRE